VLQIGKTRRVKIFTVLKVKPLRHKASIRDKVWGMLEETHYKRIVQSPVLFFNSSSAPKKEEFARIATRVYGKGVILTSFDFDEIAATQEEIMAHKVTCVAPYTIVEDTALEVEGAHVGVQIRWLIEKLSLYIGHTATWRVLLGYRDESGRAYLFHGEVKGRLVAPQGKHFYGFDPYFLPDGAQKTLGEEKAYRFSARGIAIENLMKAKAYGILPVISYWEGPWQGENNLRRRIFQGGETFLKDRELTLESLALPEKKGEGSLVEVKERTRLLAGRKFLTH
jgi:XTP/dITP diphosphohydrolase